VKNSIQLIVNWAFPGHRSASQGKTEQKERGENPQNIVKVKNDSLAAAAPVDAKESSGPPKNDSRAGKKKQKQGSNAKNQFRSIAVFVHQQVGMKLMHGVHEPVCRESVPQFFAPVRIHGHDQTFRVATWVQIHLVGNIRLVRKFDFGDALSRMSFLKTRE